MTSELIVTLTLDVGTEILCVTHFFIMLYLSVKFHQICFSSFYKQHDVRHNLTSDLIVTLTLEVGTSRLCGTHLLIMFCPSLKFR